MSDFRVENYKITGNAIEIIKNNPGDPYNGINIHDVYFYAYNGTSDVTSTAIFVQGVREFSIVNCTFGGLSPLYDTGISFGAIPAQMTMNITITACNFYHIGTFIELSTILANHIYLAGFRIINNIFIDGSYGVKASNVDYLQISENMFDYVDNPIYGDTVSNFIVTYNYLQTLTGRCIYLVNHDTQPLRFAVISNNYMWTCVAGHLVDGIVLEGVGAVISKAIISNNRIKLLKNAVLITNTVNIKVSDNIIVDCTIFIDGNTSTYIEIYNNYADGLVTVFMQNIHWSCYNKLNNIWGEKVSSRKGKLIANGDGLTKIFSVAHGLFGTPNWGNATSGGVTTAPLGISIQYDATNVSIQLATAPPVGTSNVVINWMAEI